MLRCRNIFTTQIRDVHVKHPRGGVKYGNITYYPRHPDHKDPPVEPSKLFMVQRVKPYKGNPYWHKEILEALKIHEKGKRIAIVKNIPEMNSQLWKIKHLIKITPIQFPDGLPKDGDLNGTYLHENGTFNVSHKIAIDKERLEARKKYVTNPERLDKETLKRDSRMKWLNPY